MALPADITLILPVIFKFGAVWGEHVAKTGINQGSVLHGFRLRYRI